MRLSDAIRLGFMLGPQIVDFLTDDQMGSCALGSAMLAVGAEEDLSMEYGDVLNPLLEAFPVLKSIVKVTLLDVARLGNSYSIGELVPLHSIVADLNDTGYYSREWIADWIVKEGYDCELVTAHQEAAVTAVEVCSQ